MEGSIRLEAGERKALLEHYRKSTDPEAHLRVHILLLLAAGHPGHRIATMLFTSTLTISRWKRRFKEEGVDAVLGYQAGRPRVFLLWFIAIVIQWMTKIRHGLVASCEVVVVLCHPCIAAVGDILHVGE